VRVSRTRSGALGVPAERLRGVRGEAPSEKRDESSDRAAPGKDRARARSFAAGAGTSHAPAFPRVLGSGTPLARAKRPEDQDTSYDVADAATL
jgi:hypothetical protein